MSRRRPLRAGLRERVEAARPELDWARTADAFEELYAAHRRAPPPDRTASPRCASGCRSASFIHVDLHMHTDHSHDCATPVDTLLDAAKAAGLGAIAVTDHNEVSGAHEAREKAERDGGIKVIVAEEVKTADQGEVIGLFIEEQDPARA